MKLAIVTINYNNSENTIKLLKSLENQTDKNFEIIVIDNASEESDFKNLEEQINMGIMSHYMMPMLIRNRKNLGFSGGNNVGIREALDPSTHSTKPQGGEPVESTSSGQETASDWILLLNNDTWAEKDFIASLKAILGQKRGILGLPMDEGRRISYCGKVRWLKPFGFHIYSPEEARRTNDKHIIGGGMLIHKNVFEKIGFLDENYFLYFEDVDYSIQAIKNNIPLEILEKPIVHHTPSSTTKKLGSSLLLRYHYRNALYFNLKNGPLYIKLLVWPWSWWTAVKQLLKIMLMYKQDESSAILSGIFDFYLNKMGEI